MVERLETFLKVILNSKQVVAAITAQHVEAKMETQLVLQELAFDIKQVNEMIKSGKAVISEGKIIPKGYNYRSSTELNQLEDSIMNKIKLVEMPENWY